MKRRTRLTSDQEQQTESNHMQEQTPVEFETAEELLRFDASQTAVPPSIAERLQKAIGAETDVERPWWKRWLSKK